MTDAGLSSGATFLVGLFAARTFAPQELGAYALCFSAVFLVGIVPSQGYFVPTENLLVGLPQPDRLGLLRSTIRGGLASALTAAIAVTLWLPFAPATPSGALAALTLSAGATAFLSPVQDHVRRMLHLGGRSGRAAAVSGVQVAAVVAALVVSVVTGLAKWWVPFGALAFANGVSAVVGFGLAGGAPAGATAPRVRWTDSRRSGRWLAFLGLLDAATAFVAAAIVTKLAGPAALGYAEMGRVIAQPLTVAAWGLSAVLGPRSVRAGQDLRIDEARRVSRSFAISMAVAGLALLAAFGPTWQGNPMTWLLPNAYVVKGLVVLSILAGLVNAMVFPFRSELIGARRERSIAAMELKANAVRALIATTALRSHAYAIPASLLGYGLFRWLGYRRLVAILYRGPLPGRAAEAVKV